MTDSISFLPWDSSFFNLKTGRIDLFDTTSVYRLLGTAFQDGYQLLYLFSDAPLKDVDQDFFTVQDVGGRVDYLLKPTLHGGIPSEHINGIKEYFGSISAEILNLAYLSGSQSRFKVDRQLPQNSFNRLYATWIQQELGNKANHSVYTYCVNNTIVGMLTAKWSSKECTISLLSVHPKYHGQGIACALIYHLFSICHAKHCQIIRVSTQFSNIAACRLYEKCGFNVLTISHVYHLHQNQSRQ